MDAGVPNGCVRTLATDAQRTRRWRPLLLHGSGTPQAPGRCVAHCRIGRIGAVAPSRRLSPPNSRSVGARLASSRRSRGASSLPAVRAASAKPRMRISSDDRGFDALGPADHATVDAGDRPPSPPPIASKQAGPTAARHAVTPDGQPADMAYCRRDVLPYVGTAVRTQARRLGALWSSISAREVLGFTDRPTAPAGEPHHLVAASPRRLPKHHQTDNAATRQARIPPGSIARALQPRRHRPRRHPLLSHSSRRQPLRHQAMSHHSLARASRFGAFAAWRPGSVPGSTTRTHHATKYMVGAGGRARDRSQKPRLQQDQTTRYPFTGATGSSNSWTSLPHRSCPPSLTGCRRRVQRRGALRSPDTSP
jgi:hypothetical protein